MNTRLHKTVVFTLSGLSWIMTGKGISEVLSSVGIVDGLAGTGPEIAGFTLPVILTYVAGFAVSAVIQTLIIWAYSTAWSEGVRRRPIELFIGVIGSVASGVFAAASLSTIVNHAELDRIKRNDATRPVIEVLDKSARQAGSWAADYAMLAAEAGVLARREAENGGTCENDPETGNACGPRCRWRKRQMALFAGLEVQSQGYATETSDFALQVQTVPQTEVQGVFGAAKAAEHAVEARLMAPLASALIEMREGFTDPDTGRKFMCHTAAFEARAEALHDRIQGRQSLPLRAPEWTAAEFDDAAMGVVLSAWDILWGEEPRVRGSGPYLVPALLMELLLILLLWAGRREDRRFARISSEYVIYLNSAQHLAEPVARRIRRVIAVIDRFKINAGRGRYFLAQPIDGSASQAASDIRDAIAFFGLRPSNEMVDISTVDPVWWLPREAELGGASHFEIYPLPGNLHDWRRAAMRDADHSEAAA